MINYGIFAKFYDQVIGDRKTEADIIRKLIENHCPKVKNILEVACGTGAILEYFAKSYKVIGLDISQKMLLAAKKRLPDVRFFQQDMRGFKLSDKFDAVLCLFDSINHLLKFSDWKKVFKNVHNHLNDGGIFIFDINTKEKLRRLSLSPPFIKKFNKNYAVIDVNKAEKETVNWHIKIFECQKNVVYKLYTENIKERSFLIKDIANSLLKNNYSKVDFFDQNLKKATEQSDRIYFVCKK